MFSRLDLLTAEIEAFVAAAGWDRGPVLFALIPTQVLAADPAAAAVLQLADPNQGAAAQNAEPMAPVLDPALTPVAQDDLPDGPLHEALAQIGWPPEVVGCALSQEIVMVPPAAEPALLDLSAADSAQTAHEHPDRREARLVVAVLRDGRSAGLLRLRSTDATEDELLTGEQLAPNLVLALAATLED